MVRACTFVRMLRGHSLNRELGAQLSFLYTFAASLAVFSSQLSAVDMLI